MFNTEKIFKRVLQFLFCASLIAPLVVDRRLFFPYVTTSALYFRLIVSFLFFAWIVFIFLYPKNRPKFNFLVVAFFVYFLAMTLATIFSQSPYLSFWGDAERMLGFFGFLYFLALFLIGVAIFKEKKELFWLLNFFVVVASLAALYGIFQRFGLTSIKPGEQRIVSTIGNAAIFASYLIFGLFFSVYLGLKNEYNPFKIEYNKESCHSGLEPESRKKNLDSRFPSSPMASEGRGRGNDAKGLFLWPKVLYGGLALINLIAILMTGTRGAFLGLGVGFLFLLFIIFKKSAGRKIKAGILLGLAILILLYGIFYLNQNKNWVKNNSFLARITHISLKDATIQTRLLTWKWGLQSFGEKPLLGYGFENFVEPFNKHFSAQYYNYATEEYFDRPHNILVELLSTTGIIGFAAYAFLIIAAFFAIIKKSKQENGSIYLGVFGGLLICYLAQNMFLFDSLPSMLGFVVLLIFINPHILSNSGEDKKNELPIRPIVPIILACILLVVFMSLINKTIIKPYQALKDNVAGQALLAQQNVSDGDYKLAIDYLKKSISYNTFVDLDLRASTANTIYTFFILGQVNVNEKSDIDFAIETYKNDLAIISSDTYYNYKIAEILNFRYSLDYDKKFAEEANQYIEKSIASSPGRATLYFILTENLLIQGEFDQAIEIAKKAIALNNQFGAAWWELTKADYVKQDMPGTKEALIKTVDLGYRISEKSMEQFAVAFDFMDNPQNQIEYFELVIKNGTDNYIYDSTLANLYLQIGNKEEAIAHALRSAELNPAVKERVDKFIANIQNN